MTQEKHIRLVKAGPFLNLFKKDTQYATPIFRIDQKRKNLQFVIVFKLDESADFYVLNRSEKGYSKELKRIKVFTKSQLYNAMAKVPIKARETIQILQVPSDKKQLKDFITYYDKASIDWLSYGKTVALDDVYNPFRDAYSSLFHTDSTDSAVSYDDYQGIQDFHPFSVLDNHAQALPCRYQDPIRQKIVSLQLMGWYFLGQQLKISWKPDNQHNARWRSSVVAIDRKTRRYFFQGNIYQEKGTDPVFLENLSFDCDLKNSRAAKAEFDRFIQEIKEQERVALLKLR
ncbi:hypothetical protein [Streptococcus equinus]|uniref:hypothetical protein n=1 Tax=Streptococcus equinus TaxID=1335 RepID=UPI00088EC5A2|nr:hypothetical protein [Streptococcus equinus]SDI74528.1 hypothetical protein SAMN05216384_10434 [Streptococcus equinus]SEP82495.1 hypothetical protein SAMN05216477_104126 [Streptococcus equinus]